MNRDMKNQLFFATIYSNSTLIFTNTSGKQRNIVLMLLLFIKIHFTCFVIPLEIIQMPHK